MLECLKTSAVAANTVNQEFLRDVLMGLSQRQKRIPCKYFYDRQGSQLFDAICELPEYYVTRTELAIMRDHAAEMAVALGQRAMLIEFGSGSSTKSQLLLSELQIPAAYVPIDISGQHLEFTASRLRRKFPRIEILPVCADFTQAFRLPHSKIPMTHRAVYFPGSTIGNFEPHAAAQLLANIVKICGPQGGLLIGIDLQKDINVLEAAYNDRQGVTQRFNLNVLRRANRELAADFELQNFTHRARYDKTHHRMDLRLVSRCEQTVHVDGTAFDFAKGETIHTEYSHKYTVEGFAKIAAEQGLALRKTWTDAQNFFAVLYLAVA
jgi:dimethylhistidine N-methyltransferase